MGKNVNSVSHKKSKLKENGGPKLPLAADLVEGEIAINFGKDVETLSIKNESGDVVTFSSDNYYTEKKLGSGFTGENSANTVTSVVGSGFTSSSITDVIIENEKIVSAALTDLDERKLDASAYTPTDLSNYYTKSETSGATEISNALNEKINTSDIDQVIDSGTSASTHAVATKAVVDKLIEDEQVWAISLNELNNNKFGYAEFDNNNKSIEFYKNSDEASSGVPISTVDLSSFSIDIDQVIDSGTSASTDAVSTKAVYGFVTSYTPSITVDQDFSNTASTNPISTKAVYSAITDNELVWTNAYVALSGTVSAHTANTEIHVTAADKTTWNGKIGYAEYDSTNKLIIFYDEDNGSSACTIDATDFIKDGMVNNVEIKDVASGEPAVNVTCLVITFNSDSGKQDINIPISDIFNASNYYTKAEVDARDLWVSGTGENAVAQKGISGVASGDYAVVEGYQTSGTGIYSHAEGYRTSAYSYSHAEGYMTTAITNTAHAEGFMTFAGDFSHAEGYFASATTNTSHAEGMSTLASGTCCHAEGNMTKSIGSYSHAEGYSTVANGYKSHAEGSNTTASGDSSHAEGLSTSATSSNSHAEGQRTLASSDEAHAEGYGTSATSSQAHAEGYATIASAMRSHSEGEYTVASGYGSHAEGRYTEAKNMSEHASGQYNVSSSASTTFGDSGNTLFSVGNGTYGNNHNAFEIRQNGDIYITSGGTTTSPAIKLQDYIGNITIDQVIDSGTSASTNAVSTKAVYDYISDIEYVVSTALNDLETNKLDASAYTPTDLSNYYTKSETSGATEISNALGAKVNSATYTAHTADTSVHFTTGAVQTQIDNSISGKVNTSDIVSAITPSNSGSTNPIATKVVAENELTVANALTDLDERKLDATAYTPTDLSNYYTKSETSGATEISTALGAKSDTGHTHEASGVTAMTGYQMAASSASVLTTDTLLQVIGKLEKRISLLEASVADLNSQSETVATALVELHSEIGDIETLLSQI